MASISDAIAFGATQCPQADTKFTVSFWHIPGGAKYDEARALEAFFADQEAANRFAAKYYNPPEMAFVVPYKPLFTLAKPKEH